MVYSPWISGNLLLITHQEARYYIWSLRCTHKCSICPTYQLGVLNASQVRISVARRVGELIPFQSIGAILAYPFVPYVSDEFGRRAAMFLGALIMCGATVLQTASSSVSMFIGARCVPRSL